jgi:phosphoenolpyruvate-protein phosphotransferase (PTS system enzyme I)
MSHGPATLRGIGASPGVALGRAYIVHPRRVRTPKYHIAAADVASEQLRFKTALELSIRQLDEIKKRVGVAAEYARILDVHQMMMHDPMFLDEVKAIVEKEQVNAEWAVRRSVRRIKNLFDGVKDEYFRERRSDVDFVGDRVVRNLLGLQVDVAEEIPRDAVLIARDLSPADAAILLDNTRVVGFATEVGAQTSHTAIVARAREIPGVVGAARLLDTVTKGDLVAVDGVQGMVVVRPEEQQQAVFREAMRRHLASEKALLRTRDQPAATTDGVRVRLLGNIEFAEEIPSLIAHGAEGIGLYRSEFLYLGRNAPPTEDEHYEAYKAALSAFAPRPVTIRTFDLGAEKFPDGERSRVKEPNPALGLRAIRYSLKHRDQFRTQLRAMLRASVHGNLRIMFPMICGLTELREARSAIERVKEELGRAGEPIAQKIPVGIMVETPSAASIADRLALECDFFAVGTNDLIQYSLAMDRQNREVAYLYRPLHLALLRQLDFVVTTGKKAGIGVSICGEMAGDPMNTLILLGLGFDELSMSSAQIPAIKRLIRATSAAEGRKLLEQVMELNTSEEIERVVRLEMHRRFGDNLAQA